MLYSEMLDEMRLLTTSQKNCSAEVLSILQNQKCLYALSMVENTSSKYSSFVAVNKIMQRDRYNYCKEIFQELYDIPHAVIKGAVLSEIIYGRPYYRASGDIDLLVSTKHIEHIACVLKKNGFVQGKVKEETIEKFKREEELYYKLYTHQLATFEKKTDSLVCPFLNIDVNFKILWGESSQIIDMDEYLLHTERRSVFGIEVSVLEPVYEFIALCLHHYKDMNSIYLLAERGLSLYEFYDIFYYIINVKPDIEELCSVAERYQIKEYVYYCIYYANEIFRNPLLEQYLVKLENQQALRLLDYYGLDDWERKKWTIPFPDRLLGSNFKVRFVESLSDAEIQKVTINKLFM